MNDARPVSSYRLAELGSLLSDPSRVAILYALMDGSARPAGELARMACVAPATASEHLRRLLDGGFLAVWQQGRHRYYRLASAEVAAALESLSLVRPPTLAALRAKTDPHTRRARVCYDHLAGLLGVALFERICARSGWLLASDAVRLSDNGIELLSDLGLAGPADEGTQLPGRACVDWTERRFHLAGPLGAWLADRLFNAEWLRRRPGARTIVPTARGRDGLGRLGLSWEALEERPHARGHRADTRHATEALS